MRLCAVKKVNSGKKVTCGLMHCKLLHFFGVILSEVLLNLIMRNVDLIFLNANAVCLQYELEGFKYLRKFSKGYSKEHIIKSVV